MKKEIGTKVKNERLGLKGEITGYTSEPSVIVKDEHGQQWIGAINSPFYDEWKEDKNMDFDEFVEKLKDAMPLNICDLKEGNPVVYIKHINQAIDKLKKEYKVGK